MVSLVPALGLALASFLGEADARAVDPEQLCAEAGESLDELGASEHWDAGDCAPIELLPDVSCEDPPSTFWPLAVNACDTPLLKVRRGGPSRAPRLQSAHGRRPLKGVAARDEGSIRSCGGSAPPLPQRAPTLVREPALPVHATMAAPAARRLSVDRGQAAPLAAGHSRRLERPPEA